MVTVFASNLCPYAQRTRALLAHLDVAHELRIIDLKNKPADFLALSPTGRVPMLLDGDVRLYESYVINEYLVEKLPWTGGLSRDPKQRARERLAMLQFDNVVLPAYVSALRNAGQLEDARRTAIERELDELEKTASLSDEPVNLPGLHVAPHTLRMKWMGKASPLPELLEARPSLSEWLVRHEELPAMRDTTPDRAETVEAYREMFGIAV